LYSDNLYNQPKVGIYNISILGLIILVMGQSNMPITKEEKMNFEVPHK
jgi:hypothetical protein